VQKPQRFQLTICHLNTTVPSQSKLNLQSVNSFMSNINECEAQTKEKEGVICSVAVFVKF